MRIVFCSCAAAVRGGRRSPTVRRGPGAVRPSGRQAVGIAGLAVPVDGRLLGRGVPAGSGGFSGAGETTTTTAAGVEERFRAAETPPERTSVGTTIEFIYSFFFFNS